MKVYKVFVISLVALILTGCGNEEYLGTYESSNGSEIVLKENGECAIKVVEEYFRSGFCNAVYAYRASVGGSARVIHNGTMCYYEEKMVTSAKSCFYEFNEDHIILTHDIRRSTTNKYNFSVDYETLTWESTGKTYNKK